MAHRFWALTANRALPPGQTATAAGHARRVDARITRRRTRHPDQSQPPQAQNVRARVAAATAQIQIKVRVNPARNADVDHALIAPQVSRAWVISAIALAKVSAASAQVLCAARWALRKPTMHVRFTPIAKISVIASQVRSRASLGRIIARVRPVRRAAFLARWTMRIRVITMSPVQKSMATACALRAIVKHERALIQTHAIRMALDAVINVDATQMARRKPIASLAHPVKPVCRVSHVRAEKRVRRVSHVRRARPQWMRTVHRSNVRPATPGHATAIAAAVAHVQKVARSAQRQPRQPRRQAATANSAGAHTP